MKMNNFWVDQIVISAEKPALTLTHVDVTKSKTCLQIDHIPIVFGYWSSVV